jgi:hypothetical protein
MRARGRWLAGLLACSLGAVRAQTTLTETPVQYSTWGPASDAALAAHWGLTAEDVQRYHHYMAVEGQYFYRHLDPVMVLGLIETDPAQRTRYAEKYLETERRRIEAQIRFATLAATVQFQRFGLEKWVDFSTLRGARARSGDLATRARPDAGGNGATRPRAARPTAPGALAASPPRAPVQPQAGDTVDVLVEPDCGAACYQKLAELLKIPEVRIRIYGRHFKDTPAFIAWLEQRPGAAATRAADAKRLEPRRFDPLLFRGVSTLKAPVALWRRQGALLSPF